jgi:hypothetical protein
MILYISQKTFNPTPQFSKYEKSFPHFCRYFYYSYLAILSLPWCPVDIRRRRSASWIFNWKGEVVQFRNNCTMLVLKITIRLLVIYKRTTKLGLQTSIQEGYTLTEWGNLVKSKNILARIEGTSIIESPTTSFSFITMAPHSYSHGKRCRFWVATILESVRAFLYTKKAHKMILLSCFRMPKN